jgi:methylthioribose-1-phosphate isomerase
MKFSLLFWPIQLKGKTIYVLDETLLPEKVKFIRVTTYQGACQAIKQMKTRAVGQVRLAMYALLLECRKNKGRPLEKAADALNKSRPTLAFKMLTDMVLGWHKSGQNVERNILGFLEGLKHKRIAQAQEVCGLLRDKDGILTHCNISGLMPLIGEICRQGQKRLKFIVTETRPYLQGARLTAWELTKDGFDTTLICDNMVAQVMSEGKVNKVIVGADHLAQNGDIANKIGTLQIALLAKYFGIPFYVICPPASRARTGQDIPIEIRPDEELLKIFGKRIAAKGVKAYYPAFDVTTADLIAKHIHLR